MIDPNPTTRALSVGAACLTAWLVGSGIWLFFFYRPAGPPAAWEDVVPDQGNDYGVLVQLGHRFATPLLFLLLFSLVLMAARETDWFRIVGWTGALVLAIGAGVTGLYLPWDQLALVSVTVGTNMSGYTPLFGDDVTFVLANGAVVSTEQIIRFLIAHTVLGVLVALFVAVLTRRRRVS